MARNLLSGLRLRLTSPVSNYELVFSRLIATDTLKIPAATESDDAGES